MRRMFHWTLFVCSIRVPLFLQTIMNKLTSLQPSLLLADDRAGVHAETSGHLSRIDHLSVRQQSLEDEMMSADQSGQLSRTCQFFRLYKVRSELSEPLTSRHCDYHHTHISNHCRL